VLDAQYFGVAQRRRRVFVVGCLGDWRSAAEVLFEPESLRRDSPPSREKGKEVAAGTTSGTRERCSHWDGDFPHPTLNQSAKGSGGVGASNQEIFSQRGAYLAPHPVGVDVNGLQHTVGTLCADTHPGAYSGQDAYTGRLVPAYGIPGNWIGRKPENGGNAVEPMHDVAPCLTKTDRHGVAQAIPLNSMNCFRSPDAAASTGCGIGEPGEAMFTITKTNHHAVAQPMVLMDQGGSVMSVLQDGTVGTLRRETHGHEPVVLQPTAYAFDSLSSNSMKSSNPISGVNEVSVSKTLDTSRGLDPSCNQGGIGIVSPTLTASNDPSRSPQSTEVTNQVAAVHAASMAVRRLTPTECERLQGFPDSYTNIPWRKQPESPDGSRYKALGNSMAVPVMAWIGRRIANAP